MAKAIVVSVNFRKDTPPCCRESLVRFGALDRYRGAGEPGDRIRCGCGNWLEYGHRGWRVVSGVEVDGDG